MERKAREDDALRKHIKHLKHAVATTTCPKTVDVLRQMLRETEATLCQIDARRCGDQSPPIGRTRTA